MLMPNTAAPADYPRWDERHATTMLSTEDVAVDVDIDPNDDGSQLIIRRTVWSKAYRAKDRHILWTGTVAIIPREGAAQFAKDLVCSLAA